MSEEDRAAPFAALRSHQYANLTTFRKNGDAVPTPVWFAVAGDRVYVQTGAGSGKVKRVHATSRLTLAPSDQRGAPRGAGGAGIARVLDGAEAIVAERALQQKYGLRRRLFFLAARLASRLRRRPGLASTYLEIRPRPASGVAAATAAEGATPPPSSPAGLGI